MICGGETPKFLAPHRGGGTLFSLSPHGWGETDPIAPPEFLHLGGHLPPLPLRIWGGNDLVPPPHGGEANTTSPPPSEDLVVAKLFYCPPHRDGGEMPSLHYLISIVI